MLLCAAGDIHGAIDRMYDDVLAFENTLGKRFGWVLHACYPFAADAGSSREAPSTFPWDRSSLNFSMSLSKNFGGNKP